MCLNVDSTSNNQDLYDAMVVGAGLAGLTCARQLQQQGYKVILLDKSRGVGGRIATRRIDNTPVDRGLFFLELQGQHTQKLIEQLRQQNIIQLWHGRFCQLNKEDNLQPIESVDRYIAPAGINAIAKYLARDLEIKKPCRAIAIEPTKNNTWLIIAEDGSQIRGKAIVMAIPAPQAVDILTSMGDRLSCLIKPLRSVKFHPCITVTVGYDDKYLSDLPAWEVLKIDTDEHLRWIILDSSKRDNIQQPVFVLHSSPQFADKHLDANKTNLESAGNTILDRATSVLSWLQSPQWMQVHRWRYAIPSQAIAAPFIATNNPLPLVCCGDWCNGQGLESALISGLASAKELQRMYH